MWIYFSLFVITAVYLLFSAVMDIRERMVFAFPAIVLHLLWSLYLCTEGTWRYESLAVFWLFHLCIYIFMNHLKIWGSGDSDILMLFSDLVLIALTSRNGYQLALYECFALIIGLMISIGIGVIENKVREKKSSIHSSVAVIPGMAAVMILLMIRGMMWRWM